VNGPETLGSSAASSPAERTKVVYVMGSGHSGSTILGVALNSCDGFFYAGEMDKWLVRRGRSVIGGTARTDFWDVVRERVGDVDGLEGAGSQKYLERSSALLRSRSARRRLREQWRLLTPRLYRTIASTAQAAQVVDTSHFPLRARELGALDEIDLYLILLFREPEQIVHSFLRHINPHNVVKLRLRTLKVNADIWVTYLLSLFVFAKQPRERRVVLKHEDFLNDPERVLEQLLSFVGSPAAPPDFSRLDSGYPLQGNKGVIGEQTVMLRRGAPHSPRSSRFTRAVQAPWMAVFARLSPRITIESHQ